VHRWVGRKLFGYTRSLRERGNGLTGGFRAPRAWQNSRKGSPAADLYTFRGGTNPPFASVVNVMVVLDGQLTVKPISKVLSTEPKTIPKIQVLCRRYSSIGAK